MSWRLLFAAPFLVLLSFFGWTAVTSLRVDRLWAMGMQSLEGWNRFGAPPGDANWSAAVGFFEEVDSLAPSSPAAGLVLGSVLGRGADRPELTDAAIAHLHASLRFRPVSPYSWAALAEARYRAGWIDEEFRLALRRAAELGKWEPEVQDKVVLYGLGAWDELDQPTRQAVLTVVAAGMKRDGPAMLQISMRRGRLDVACRYVSETSRKTEKWAGSCNGTEARP